MYVYYKSSFYIYMGEVKRMFIGVKARFGFSRNRKETTHILLERRQLLLGRPKDGVIFLRKKMAVL